MFPEGPEIIFRRIFECNLGLEILNVSNHVNILPSPHVVRNDDKVTLDQHLGDDTVNVNFSQTTTHEVQVTLLLHGLTHVLGQSGEPNGILTIIRLDPESRITGIVLRTESKDPEIIRGC